jgi:hypothetical protein
MPRTEDAKNQRKNTKSQVSKKEYKKLGTSSRMAPRVRQTTALIIITVLRLILGSPFLKQIYANLLTLYKVMELT